MRSFRPMKNKQSPDLGETSQSIAEIAFAHQFQKTKTKWRNP